MKKTTKIWLIVAAVLVIVGGMMFTFALAKEDFDFRELVMEEMKINNYEVGEPFDKIYIDSDTTDIEFYTYREDKVRVGCTETKKIKYNVTVEDSTLKIEVKDTRKWYERIGFFFGDMKLTVYLPGGAEYSSVVIHNTTGDVIIPEQIYADILEVKITTGDIECRANVTDSVKLKTTTGAIKLYGTSCQGDVDITLSTGRTEVSDVSCRNFSSKGTTGDVALKKLVASEGLYVKRTTADITLESSDASDIDINTTTGDVTGSLLSDKIFTVKTTTGDIDLPDTANGGNCKIKTTTGDIKITIE